MYLKKEVAEKVTGQLEALQWEAKRKVLANKREIKKLVLEQSVLKRTYKKYTELLWVLKNK